ncbi:MAG: glycoside hydrolase, partial [Myxococcota bacterium]
MTVSVCVHGHFYQPPRDNPWLGSVPCQPTAAPAHDWNERVANECYRANVGAQVWNQGGEVVARIRTYDHISFDMGPTLMRWMQLRAPDIHQSIIQSDRQHLELRGHGGAMAQSYHHTILPLDHPRDRRTQIHWGLQDFKHRFSRHADGMW